MAKADLESKREAAEEKNKALEDEVRKKEAANAVLAEERSALEKAIQVSRERVLRHPCRSWTS